MERKSTNTFRVMSLVGLILLFFSMFLEWYSFQIVNFENTLVVSWSYYLFSEWQTPFSSTSTLNEAMKPNITTIPFFLNVIFIGAIIASGYVILGRNIDQAEDLGKYNKFAYLNIFLMLLVGFYVIICPLFYLAPYHYYFPLLSIKNYEEQLIYIYSIGPGYLLQLFSFLLIFPYTVFYYKTTATFIHEQRAPEKLLHTIILNSQEAINLDRFIAEEELKKGLLLDSGQEGQISQEEEVNRILTTFLEGKK